MRGGGAPENKLLNRFCDVNIEQYFNKSNKKTVNLKKEFTLAETDAHICMFDDKRKTAFTLAEVLITLGIIGIVIAMTLPSLIAKYQRKVWAARLQYNVSLLSQGFHKIAGENEGLQMTSLGRSVCFTTTSGSKHCSATYNCSWFYPFQRDQAKKTWQILNVGCDTVTDVDCPRETVMKKGHYWVQHTFNGSPGTVMNTIYSSGQMRLKSGAVVILAADRDRSCGKTPFYQNSLMKTSCGTLYIDINGDVSPNVIGYDLFRFALDNEGNLWPEGGAEWAKAMYADGINNNAYWQTQKSNCCTKKGDGRSCNWSQGFACAGRVVEEGWKINY